MPQAVFNPNGGSINIDTADPANIGVVPLDGSIGISTGQPEGVSVTCEVPHTADIVAYALQEGDPLLLLSDNSGKVNVNGVPVESYLVSRPIEAER